VDKPRLQPVDLSLPAAPSLRVQQNNRELAMRGMEVPDGVAPQRRGAAKKVPFRTQL
jgi:hypothetical protein